MSPEVAIRGFVDRYDPAIAAQLRACRRRMRARIRRGYEMVYDNYNALVIGYTPSQRASDAVLSIVGYPRWVTLFFMDGVSLPDPTGRLEGSGRQVRGIRLAGPSDLEAPDVRALIDAALADDAEAFAVAPPLRTVIKSVAARQRPRRPARVSAPSTGRTSRARRRA